MHMSTVDNFIESKYRDLGSRISIEYIDLYKTFSNRNLQEIFSTIHSMFVENYTAMNSRLPTNRYTANYWANNSRELMLAIDVLKGIERVLKSTDNAFNIVPYYESIIDKSMGFLKKSGGSIIPIGMDKVDIYYTEPILTKKDSVILSDSTTEQRYANLKPIGAGSYATVYSFFDSFYNRKFVLKRANADLTPKEIERFKQEYEQMTKLSSPYIVEVYRYDGVKNEYIMEYIDFNLKNYIKRQNPSVDERKNIISQVFRAFKFIHSKDILHRDISPLNIMIKTYDDVNVVKVCDFGLVKIPNSDLTSFDTKLKGCYNDPALVTEGFKNYTVLHETYALTKLIVFIMTGNDDVDKITDIKLKAFVEKGLSPDKSIRYKSVDEMIAEFKKV